MISVHDIPSLLTETLERFPWSFWVTLFALAILLLLASVIRRPPDPFPYKRADALFTESERDFLLILDEAVGEDFRILGKVRLADIIQVQAGLESSHWQAAFNRIRAKHLDYVGCDLETLEILWVLELDDISHQRPERMARDEFVEGALARAGVPLIRVPVADEYDPIKLQHTILKHLRT